MGFRNPVRTAVDPVARDLASRAGRTVQTATTGPRVEMGALSEDDGDSAGYIRMYAGWEGEEPATFGAADLGTGGKRVGLTGGTDVFGQSAGFLGVSTENAPQGARRSRADVQADVVWLGATRVEAGDYYATRGRFTASTDASLVSTGHAFQAGPDYGTHIIGDGNEFVPRVWDAAAGVYKLGTVGWAGARLVGVGDPTQPTDAATKGWVESLRAEAAPSYANGWTAGNITGYSNLRFYLSRDGMVTVHGTCKVGTTTTICPLSGSYAPRDGAGGGFAQLQGETPRAVTISNDALLLRGSLPAAGQWLLINATYPGATATT
jgi:hypothetical protein